MARIKAAVSERALYARINRTLAKDDEALRRCREDSRSFHDLGRYYIVDLNCNFVTHLNCDLEKLGRRLDVLSPWEALDDADYWR